MSNLLRELHFQFVVFVTTDLSWFLIQEPVKISKGKITALEGEVFKLPVDSDSSIIFDSSPKAYLSRRNISDDISKRTEHEG